MIFRILVLLVVVAVAATAPPQQSRVVVPILQGEFVRLHVGYPGVDVDFWLRWDLSDIYVLPQVGLPTRSRSYTDDSSDVVCFGSVCRLMPVTVDAYPPSPRVDTAVPIPVTGYTGVLGLGAGSPVWTVFLHYRVSARELSLMRTVPPRPPHATVVAVNGNLLALRLEGRAYWAEMRMDSDYTEVPFALSTRADRWRMELFSPSTGRRLARINVPPRRFEEPALDGAMVSSLRPNRQANNTARVHRYNSLVTAEGGGGGWNGTGIVVLGRLFLMSGFSLQHNVVTGETLVSCEWAHEPIILEPDYLGWYALVMPLLVLWVYGIVESVDYASRVAQIEFPTPPEGTAVLRLGTTDIPLPPATLVPPPPPRGIAYGPRPLSLISYRHAGFRRALVVVTQLTAVLLVLTAVLGYAWRHSFWFETYDTYDAVATYSTAAMMLLFAGGAASVQLTPSTSAMWGANAMWLALWLLGSINPYASANGMMMLLSGGAVAVMNTMQLGQFVLGRLWPWDEVYARAPLVWLALLGWSTAWSLWQFAFYTVVEQTLVWRADHPGVWALAVLAGGGVVFIAGYLVSRRELIRIGVRSAACDWMHAQTVAMVEKIRASNSPLLAHPAPGSPR